MIGSRAAGDSGFFTRGAVVLASLCPMLVQQVLLDRWTQRQDRTQEHA